MNLSEIRDILQQRVGQQNTLKEQLAEAEDRVVVIQKERQHLDNVQALVQETAKETQETLKYHIEDLIQSALDACFPGKYNFVMLFEIKRGKTEAMFRLNKDGELLDPMESNGGGVADIISFALRLATWSISRTENVLVFDEPFKFLSKNLKPFAGQILSELSHKLDLQIIMVTHDSEMVEIADRKFEVRMKNGVSNVTWEDVVDGRRE